MRIKLLPIYLTMRKTILSLLGFALIYVAGSNQAAAQTRGSQFFDEEFRPAKANDDNVIWVRYNAYYDEIQVKGADNRLSELDHRKDVLISTTDKKYTYVHTDYNTGDENVKGYLCLISNNEKAKIYSRPKIVLREGTDASGYDGPKPAEYVKAGITYFIRINDNGIVPMPSSKSKLTKMFPGKETEIKQFFKDNDISFSNETDLSKLCGFLNTIAPETHS